MMYNIDVGDTMRTILFKIKKFFLVIFSFLFHILFDRKSSINHSPSLDEKDNSEKEYQKRVGMNEKYSDEEESKSKKDFYQKEKLDKDYISIKKDIYKVYFIKKYVDDITFQLKKENSNQELKGLYEELEEYLEEIKFLKTQVEKISTSEEEHQEFVEISDKVVQEIKTDEKIIKINLDKKQEEVKEALPSINEVSEETKSEEIEYQHQHQLIINGDDKKNETEVEGSKEKEDLEDVDKNLSLKEITQNVVTKEYIEKKEEKLDRIFDEEIVVKKVPSSIKKSEEEKQKKKEVPDNSQRNIAGKNDEIGIYKAKLENIRNMIRNINLSKQRKVIKKVASSITTAVLVLSTLSPVMNNKKNLKKSLATALVVNNKLRNSINVVSHKKKKKLKYEDVVLKTQSYDDSINMNYILNDALTQIRQLRSILCQYGLTSEVMAILNQLDELEMEMLEKINNINTKAHVYVKK